MAQINPNLNNQMQNFYTSEIIVLPKKINSFEFDEKLEERIILIKEMIDDYLLSKKDFSSIKNLSFFNLEYANFPIEEVRRMQTEAEYSASFSGQDQRAFILLNFDSASIPAQNAALKIIEESPKNTLILLLVSRKEKILETITSRCLIVQMENDQVQKSENALINFSWPKNYAQVIELAQENKDRAKAIDLVEKLLEDKSLLTKKKQALLKSYQDLRNNQNVQLVLENCFFSLVSLES
jgi:DNA polymerase III delta prime subunit